MKTLLVILLLVSSSSFAADYIAAGASLKEGAKALVSTMDGFACLTEEYEKSPSCEQLVKINQAKNNILNAAPYSGFLLDCGGKFYEAKSVGQLNKKREEISALVQDAPQTHKVWAEINGFGNAISTSARKIAEVFDDAKYQDIYVNECL